MVFRVDNTGSLTGLRIDPGHVSLCCPVSRVPSHIFFINEGRLLCAEMCTDSCTIISVSGTWIPLSISSYYSVLAPTDSIKPEYVHVIVKTEKGYVDIMAKKRTVLGEIRGDLDVLAIRNEENVRYYAGPFRDRVEFAGNTIRAFTQRGCPKFVFDMEHGCDTQEIREGKAHLKFLEGGVEDILGFESYKGGGRITFCDERNAYLLEYQLLSHAAGRCRLYWAGEEDYCEPSYSIEFLQEPLSVAVKTDPGRTTYCTAPTVCRA